ncbi:MAG: uroporphyrinogen-III synthase [Cellvibrionaceae bacterium]|nr:uroporphyrinogen-III synthase [Cellvibrionaceae bacterium]
MKVLATRPKKQNAAWISRLEGEGYRCLAAPLIEIRAAVGEQSLRAIERKILSLDHFYALIFVSQNAVDFGLDWIDRYWPQVPAQIYWFAVGAKTAQCLNAHPLLSGENILAATGEMNSEALLQFEGLQQARVNEKKILIFRGLGGRTLLGDSLRDRGAEVEYCELYSRSAPAELSQLSFEVERTLVPVFSGEALQNFHAAFCRDPTMVKRAKLVVPGSRVQQLARQLGFESIEMAVNASELAMLEAIIKASDA